MEQLKVARNKIGVLSTFFIYLNENLFDDDFREVFGIFYLFGFHQARKSKARTIYGWMVFLFVLVSTFEGLIHNAVLSFGEGDRQHFLACFVMTAFVMPAVVQIVTFVARENLIVELIKALHSFHEADDVNLLTGYRVKCRKLVGVYKNFIIILFSSFACLYLLGFRIFKLIYPTWMDKYAEGLLYYPLLTFNLAQLYSVGLMYVSVDLIHILTMVRAGANMKILCNKLRRCTDNPDTKENEKSLIVCVNYHSRIIIETNKIENIFGHFFLSKVCGVLVVLPCLLFVFMKFSIREEPMLQIGLPVALFQIGTLCFIGQWLTQQSAEIFDASYDCHWFDQTMSFKKSLMILRIVCQRDIKVRAVKFDFSHESFYQMMSNSYSYYNIMGKGIEKIGKSN